MKVEGSKAFRNADSVLGRSSLMPGGVIEEKQKQIFGESLPPGFIISDSIVGKYKT